MTKVVASIIAALMFVASTIGLTPVGDIVERTDMRKLHAVTAVDTDEIFSPQPFLGQSQLEEDDLLETPHPELYHGLSLVGSTHREYVSSRFSLTRRLHRPPDA